MTITESDQAQEPGGDGPAAGEAVSSVIQSPAVRAIYELWRSKRAAAGGLVLRADIDPIDIGARNLPHVAIIELLEDGDLRYRLVGGHILEYIGYDFSGWRVSEYYRDKPDDGSPEDYHTAIAERRPMHSRANLIADGRSYVIYERLILPMSSDGIRVDRLLVAFQFQRDRDSGAGRQVTAMD